MFVSHWRFQDERDRRLQAEARLATALDLLEKAMAGARPPAVPEGPEVKPAPIPEPIAKAISDRAPGGGMEARRLLAYAQERLAAGYPPEKVATTILYGLRADPDA